jgi:hypothetical protein
VVRNSWESPRLRKYQTVKLLWISNTVTSPAVFYCEGAKAANKCEPDVATINENYFSLIGWTADVGG